MVKIRFKHLVLSIVLFIFLANVVYAAGTKLLISDVDVVVGGNKDTNLADSEIIGEDARPGDNVDFKITIQNNFTSQEDLKIRNIIVKATIEGIDNDDDLEEESSEFDLSPGNDKKVTLKFQVPIEVDEDTFDVKIEVEGDDKNNTNHERVMTLKLEVDKESHSLKIVRKTLNPAEVACSRKNVQLGATLINIGSEDEEDISFTVANPDLGLNLKDTINELTSEPNEDESRFSKTYTFSVPEDLEADSYPITLTALYDDDRKKAEETATLTVNECPTAVKKTANEDVKEQPNEDTSSNVDEEEVEVITPTGKPSNNIQPLNTLQPTVPTGTVVTQESFFKSNTFIVGVVIAEIIAVIIGIVLVAMLFKRKE